MELFVLNFNVQHPKASLCRIYNFKLDNNQKL